MSKKSKKVKIKNPPLEKDKIKSEDFETILNYNYTTEYKNGKMKIFFRSYYRINGEIENDELQMKLFVDTDEIQLSKLKHKLKVFGVYNETFKHEFIFTLKGTYEYKKKDVLISIQAKRGTEVQLINNDAQELEIEEEEI